MITEITNYLPNKEPDFVPVRGAVIASGKENRGWGFPEIFVLSQTAFPALLYLPGTQPFRVPIRAAAFGVGLAALAWWLINQRAKKEMLHPAAKWLVLAVIWLVLMIFHPATNTIVAGVAQTLLYLSVLSPVFWAPSMVKQPQQLRRLLGLLLACNGVNSLVGVLQVYYPATWMPMEFSQIVVSSAFGLGNFSYISDAGTIMIRPPGLFDYPGAVCMAGMPTALLGLAFFISKTAFWQRVISGLLAGVGLLVIYFSHVRSAFLVTVGMMMVYLILVVIVQRQVAKGILYLLVMVSALGLATYYVMSFGGQATSNRFKTLTERNLFEIYYESRGSQVASGFTELLPTYPLGAGLGRWGMMRTYFGNEGNKASPPIWAEIQFPAWILDGGILLLVLFVGALIVSVGYEFRQARKAEVRELKFCLPIIFAINIGVLAFLFSYCPFVAPIGMQYWFIAGALHGVVRGSANPPHENIHNR